jgi:hypothetical protein
MLTQVWVVFTLAMTGKFLIAAAFAIAYLFTAELFPTPVRYCDIFAVLPTPGKTFRPIPSKKKPLGKNPITEKKSCPFLQ